MKLRTQSHKAAPHFRCLLLLAGPRVTHKFYLTWLQIGGSRDPPLGFNYLLEQLTEPRETLVWLASLLVVKTMRRDPGEQPDEQVHRILEGSPVQELLSCGAGVLYPPHT